MKKLKIIFIAHKLFQKEPSYKVSFLLLLFNIIRDKYKLCTLLNNSKMLAALLVLNLHNVKARFMIINIRHDLTQIEYSDVLKFFYNLETTLERDGFTSIEACLPIPPFNEKYEPKLCRLYDIFRNIDYEELNSWMVHKGEKILCKKFIKKF